MCVHVLSCFSCVWLFAVLGTIAHQAPLSMGFPRWEYWSGFPLPPPGDLPNPGIQPASSIAPGLLQVESIPLEPPGKPIYTYIYIYTTYIYICIYSCILSFLFILFIKLLCNNLTIYDWCLSPLSQIQFYPGPYLSFQQSHFRESLYDIRIELRSPLTPWCNKFL